MVRWTVPKNINDPETERKEMMDFVFCLERTIKSYSLTKEEALWILLSVDGFEND